MASQDGDSAKRPTIYDVAKIVGTSPTAVSSVLNGSWKKRRISEALAGRIMKIAEERGYSVNLQASLLRRERSHIIGMIVPKYDNRYFGAIAEHFEARARANGLFPVITCTQRDPELEVEAARELLSYQVECLVLTGATDPDRIGALCGAAGVRTVNLDLPGSLAPSIISDNYLGAKDLSGHVLDVCAATFDGDMPLVFVGGRATDHNTERRIRGFLDAHAERGIAVPDGHVLACGYAAEKARAALAAFEGSVPLGLFVNSTITLEGVVAWIAGLEAEVAAGIRYGTFDWDPFAALLPQNVGMVRQDVTKMLDLVFEWIADPSEWNGMTLVPCKLERGMLAASPVVVEDTAHEGFDPK